MIYFKVWTLTRDPLPEPTSEPRDTNYPHAISSSEEASNDDQTLANPPHQNIEESSDKLNVPFVQYVLIGGGMASYYAMKTIKKVDSNAQILIIGQESNVPYSRPPLSKELWDSSDDDLENWMFKDYNGTRRSLFYDTTSFIDAKDSDFSASDKVHFLNGSVTSIDTAEESVKMSNGEKIRYGKLLIATGGSPKILPSVKNLPKESRDRVLTFRGVSFLYNFSLMTLKNYTNFSSLVIKLLQ